MKNRKKSSYLIVGVLLIGVIFIIISIFGRYSITSNEPYKIDKENLIEDGSFEDFNKEAWDCCPNNAGNASIFVSKCEDSFDGEYSLNLTSSNHCACTSKLVSNFSNIFNYLISFHYKGDNPRFCNWVEGDRKCLPNKILNSTKEWTKYKRVLVHAESSLSSLIVFYADSSGSPVTNLYDDLQVHKLIPIENPSEYEYNSEEEYIFKTKADNNVKGEIISDVDAKTGEAYFLTTGKPYVTIKFPWSEIIIVIIIVLIIIRLLFKKQVLQTEEAIVNEEKKIVKEISENIEKIEQAIVPEQTEEEERKEEGKEDLTNPHRRKLGYSEIYKKRYEERFGKK